jgi:hypothetical protein
VDEHHRLLAGRVGPGDYLTSSSVQAEAAVRTTSLAGWLSPCSLWSIGLPQGVSKQAAERIRRCRYGVVGSLSGGAPDDRERGTQGASLGRSDSRATALGGVDIATAAGAPAVLPAGRGCLEAVVAPEKFVADRDRGDVGDPTCERRFRMALSRSLIGGRAMPSLTSCGSSPASRAAARGVVELGKRAALDEGLPIGGARENSRSRRARRRPAPPAAGRVTMSRTARPSRARTAPGPAPPRARQSRPRPPRDRVPRVPAPVCRAGRAGSRTRSASTRLPGSSRRCARPRGRRRAN